MSGSPALPVAALLLAVYSATMARGLTFWDAGEFLSAVRVLGIPHPPGTPLYVLAARVWSMALAPATGFAVAVNAFSATCTAIAFGIVAHLFHRWTGSSLIGFCAGVTPGLMSTVWLNATETEVYAASLLVSMLIMLAASRQANLSSSTLLVAYLTGLGWSLHLTALLTFPAAIVLLLSAPTPIPPRVAWRRVAAALALVVIGASPVLYLLIRAVHDPPINQGNPSTLSALVAVIQRHQYDVAPVWPRRAPLWLQLGNVVEYADWQVGLGLAPDPPPEVWRTSLTLLYAALGICGSAYHRRLHAPSWRAWTVLLAVTSIGVVLYLNLRAGTTFGIGILPAGAPHEARDRDYFFTWAFAAWGAWAGVGAAAAVQSPPVRRLLNWISPRLGVRHAAGVGLAVTLALTPAATNWSAVVAARRDQLLAERAARRLLAPLPPRAVLIARGDNDTYPLWYMQQVQRFRTDVTVVTAPLLPPEWYRAELRRRYALLDSRYVSNWLGGPATLSEVERRAAAQGRPVVHSPGVAAP